MANKKLFHEYIRVRNIRDGIWVDGKMVSIFLDLQVGPFTFKGVSYKWATDSLRLNQRRSLQLKPSYIHVIVDLIKKEIDKRRDSGYLELVKRSSDEHSPEV